MESSSVIAMSRVLFASLVLQAGAQTMHLGCLAEHCALSFLEAVVHPQFTLNSICEMGCGKVYDKDPTPEKLEY